MKTKIISLDSFDFYVSLNYFGSNLGLLPGMGLFQMIEGMEILTLSISRRGVGTKPMPLAVDQWDDSIR